MYESMLFSYFSTLSNTIIICRCFFFILFDYFSITTFSFFFIYAYNNIVCSLLFAFCTGLIDTEEDLVLTQGDANVIYIFIEIITNKTISY